MMRSGFRNSGLPALVSALCLLGSASGVLAQASGTPTTEQLIEALKSKTSRGVTPSTPEAANPTGQDAQADAVLQELRNKVSRGLSVTEMDRSKAASAVRSKPKFDYEVGFEFGSDQLSTSALPYLSALGRAMQSPELKDGTFLVAGHTDAKGTAPFNQKLSERRAQSVVRYLEKNFGLRSDQLVPMGYGKEQLKTPSEPYADQNRRVEVVNITPTVVSQSNR